jgi:drug/metabolite transporter (DMT)-like permease
MSIVNNSIKGHAAALATISIWGTTFVSTKVLLIDFEPIEIIFYRFVIGLIVLLIAYPNRLKWTGKKRELMFMAAGLCGVTMYYMLQNIALTYTTASNVGVITSIGPIFTALLAYWLLNEKKLTSSFFIGFLVAITGISLISFSGITALQLNPVGDLLALMAAVFWAIYSILVRRISEYGYDTIQVTRRIFFYGLAFMMPTLFVFRFNLGIERFSQPSNIFNILFLGVLSSALCFVTWNSAVKLLGAVKTSVYIYLVPVITIAVSVVVLNEKITHLMALGIFLTIAGLFLSEKKEKPTRMNR